MAAVIGVEMSKAFEAYGEAGTFLVNFY